jgi:Predicted amidohydrolase
VPDGSRVTKQRIALLQMTAGRHPERSADTVSGAIAAARAGGAVMLFTPEFSGFMERRRTGLEQLAVEEKGDGFLARVRAVAAEHALWVHLGSHVVRMRAGHLVNRSYLVAPTGKIVAHYDKMHMFDVDLPGGAASRESDVFRAGNRAVVAETPLGPLGMLICYDVRFPALSQALISNGATLLSVPAAFTAATGPPHWHLLLRARAVESGAFVVAAAQTGRHEDGRESYGHSLVVDPWGDIVLDLGREPGLGFVDIDPARQAEVRSRIPSHLHRRRIGVVRHFPPASRT